MSEDREGFFERWSRLKRTGRQEPDPPAPPPPAREAAGNAPATGCEGTPEDGSQDNGPTQSPGTPAAAPPALPDVTSLTADSDFTAFLAAEVPEETHRQALRALWRSDPLFAERDGLTDYAEDFNAPDKALAFGRTLYRALAGYAEPADGDVAETAGGEGQRPVRKEAEDAADFDGAARPLAADDAPVERDADPLVEKEGGFSPCSASPDPPLRG